MGGGECKPLHACIDRTSDRATSLHQSGRASCPTMSMVRWCLLSLLTASVADPPPGHTTLIVLLHDGHTGTHALCEAFGKLGCVLADCNEPGFSEASVKLFVEQAQREGKHFAVRIYWTRIMKDAGTKRALRSWIQARRIWFLMQTRLDLMRWALSNYCKLDGFRCAWERADPQFHHEVVSTEHSYELSRLDHVAETLLWMWDTCSI